MARSKRAHATRRNFGSEGGRDTNGIQLVSVGWGGRSHSVPTTCCQIPPARSGKERRSGDGRRGDLLPGIPASLVFYSTLWSSAVLCLVIGVGKFLDLVRFALSVGVSCGSSLSMCLDLQCTWGHAGHYPPLSSNSRECSWSFG